MKNQEIPLKEIQQWTLLGPLLMSVTLFVILFTPARPFFTAFIAIIGFPFCWKWKLSGAACAGALLIGAVTYHAIFSNEDQLYWQVSSALTVALTFYLTALCSKEVDQLFADYPASTEDALSSTWQNTDTEYMALIQKGAYDQKIAEGTISALKLQLTDKEDQLHARTQIMVSEQKILFEIQGQNETLLQELFQCRHECTVLKQQYDDLREASAQKEALLLMCQEEMHANTQMLASEQKTLLEIQRENETLQQEIFQSRCECTVLKQQYDELQASPALKEALLLKQLPEAKNAQHSEIEAVPFIDKAEVSPIESLKPKPATKGKSQKQTKTTHWANTILSRCSESHDPQK